MALSGDSEERTVVVMPAVSLSSLFINIAGGVLAVAITFVNFYVLKCGEHIFAGDGSLGIVLGGVLKKALLFGVVGAPPKPP
jgi:hypothetical protein